MDKCPISTSNAGRIGYKTRPTASSFGPVTCSIWQLKVTLILNVPTSSPHKTQPFANLTSKLPRVVIVLILRIDEIKVESSSIEMLGSKGPCNDLTGSSTTLRIEHSLTITGSAHLADANAQAQLFHLQFEVVDPRVDVVALRTQPWNRHSTREASTVA